MDATFRKKLIKALIIDDSTYIASYIECDRWDPTTLGDGMQVLRSILRSGWKGFENMSDEELMIHAEDRKLDLERLKPGYQYP